MPLTNFPGGVSSFGMPVIDTMLARYGVTGPVKFVCNRSNVVNGFGELDSPYSTLKAALADTDLKANSGGACVVLPGHSQNVADNTELTSLVNGVAILGIGSGSAMPVFRTTATTSQFVLDNAGTVLAGLRLRLEGANGVVKAVNITGEDVLIDNCDIEVASGATAKSTIAVEIGSAALRCRIMNNIMRGTDTHNVTDGIKVVGATVPSDLEIGYNRMIFSATAGNGNVHITVAALRCYIHHNTMYNTHTASTACLAVDNVAADGILVHNFYGTKNDGVATAQGATFGAAALFVSQECYSGDEPKKSAVLTPAAVAT